MDADTRITAKNKRVRISVLHLAVFLLVYAINILLFLALRGYLFLLVGIILTALAPFSFYTAWRLADRIEGSILADRETVRPTETVTVVFHVQNRSFFCALRSVWLFTAGNSFYRTCDGQKLLLAIPPRGGKQFPLTVSVTNLGRIVFSCKEYILTDLLGIFAIHADCAMECSFFVLPRPDASTRTAVPETLSGVMELSESTRKGNDHSEVSDIRAYIAGDRPRDIHWKLSARHGELMVKERVSLSGSEHVLLLELPAAKEKAEKLLTEGYRLIRGLLNNHVAVRLLVWNERLFSFESSSCSDADELETAFCEIFRTDLPSRGSDLLRQYMRNCYPQLGSYLCVTEKDETVQLEICVNG